jgi:HEAT repeat protein
VVPVLDDPFDPSWADAISTLRSLGPGAVAAAAKLVELIGEYEKQRELAFGALVTMGPQVLPAVQPLVDSEDANLRIIAGRVLCRNGQRERGMQMLLAELSHPREQVRHLATGGLSEVIADFPDQTLPIVAMLRGAKESRGRAAAASALYFADPHADRPAVQALIAALADPDAGVRRSAAFVLGAMSDSPPPCAGPLRQSRFAAFSEFVKYRESRQRPWPDMPTAIVALASLLQDPEAGPRDAAVHALGMAGRESIPVLPLLKMLENDESQEVRFQLSNAWRRIEPWNLALDRPERPVFRPPRRAR